MSDSLRDQLLKAGLVTRKQATQVHRQQQQQKFRETKGHQPSPEELARRQAAEQARAAKAARDQELNRQRQISAEARARELQVAQIVEAHRLPKPDSEEFFNFVDRGKVRRMPVDAALRERLGDGRLCIVRNAGRYELLAPEVAERIRAIHPAALVNLAAAAAPAAPAADDPYKDFVVPDDLIW